MFLKIIHSIWLSIDSFGLFEASSGCTLQAFVLKCFFAASVKRFRWSRLRWAKNAFSPKRLSAAIRARLCTQKKFSAGINIRCRNTALGICRELVDCLQGRGGNVPKNFKNIRNAEKLDDFIKLHLYPLTNSSILTQIEKMPLAI